MSENFLTIISIAKELGLPESTVRFYRDKFLEYIPFEGEGRKRKYRPEALRVLRFIACSLRSGKTSKKTAEDLLGNFPQYINSTDENTELKMPMVLQESQLNQLAKYEQKLASYEQKTQILLELVKSLSREVIAIRKENNNNKNNKKHKELFNRIERLETERFSSFAERKKLSELQKELNKLKRPLWKRLLGIG